MAAKRTTELLARLRQGSDKWNEFRHEHKDIPIELGGVDLSGFNLAGFDLSGVSPEDRLLSAIFGEPELGQSLNLDRANLREANLAGANLSGANLMETDLSKANLSKSNLARAHLNSADLSAANLPSANLSKANLSCAILRGADLSYADLSGANLSGADLSGSTLFHTNFSQAKLNGVEWHDSRIAEAILNPEQKRFALDDGAIDDRERPNVLSTADASGKGAFQDDRSLLLYLDSGNASKETIQSLLEALSAVHVAAGGAGLHFENDGELVRIREAVLA